MGTSNADIAKLLRSVAAALTLKKANFFQIRAYEGAADAIEHSSADLKDLWEEKKLGDVPGLGEKLQAHLDEVFKTGKVKHFESIMKAHPAIFYDLLDIPGVGPKTADDLTKLGVKDFKDLKEKIKSRELTKKGFSEKLSLKIWLGLMEVASRTGRTLLPFAAAQAEKILNFLKKCPDVLQAHPLGSLRRMVPTVGDLDFSIASKNPKKVVDYFVKMPGKARIVGQGENKATIVLSSGLQVDILIGKEESYGALLQHFTGSKHHNVHLRTLAEEKGFSISEYGIRKVKSGELIPCRTEEDVYSILGMQTPAPELREDTGEIEAALNQKLPKLVELGDIKGDLHLHSNYPFDHPSHAPGIDKLEEIISRAKELGYKFVGISDHPPAAGKHSQLELTELIVKRTKFIQGLKKKMSKFSPSGIKSIQILNGLEIDILPDGSLSIPDKALETLDYCIAGIHSVHRMPKDQMTKRILKAIASPNVDILAHPTGRLLNERESYDADWEKIFKFAAENNKLLEIDGYSNRLDLRDDLVKQALKFGVKFVIDTDAHQVSQMDNMPYGVSVARRGWTQAKDVVNAWEWKRFSEWFGVKA